MTILRRTADLRSRVAGWRRSGETVAVVPTMGALHDGHLSLVRAARAVCERVIVTIFVNPRQFNSPEDYAKYPRTEEADAALLAPYGVDVVFVPEVEEMYPPGFATTVSVTGVTEPLEGAHRPGHFDGVATVVTKLLTMTGADRAFFGEKDWQQLLLVRRLVGDLNLPVEIVGCPTVRETDALALSSRNLRLSPRERQMASALPEALADVAQAVEAGAPAAPALEDARKHLAAAGFGEIEYLDLRDAETLGEARHGAPARLLVAAWAGNVRLIDNMPVTLPAPLNQLQIRQA